VLIAGSVLGCFGEVEALRDGELAYAFCAPDITPPTFPIAIDEGPPPIPMLPTLTGLPPDALALGAPWLAVLGALSSFSRFIFGSVCSSIPSLTIKHGQIVWGVMV
jgi:hypothetical protein